MSILDKTAMIIRAPRGEHYDVTHMCTVNMCQHKNLYNECDLVTIC